MCVLSPIKGDLMPAWRLLKNPRLSGSANMELDLRLFNDYESGLIPPTLRIYSWDPKCISLGYAQKMERWIDGELAGKLGWDIIRRPTGGGIVFHNEAEVTYSLVMDKEDPILPKGMVPSYKKISEAIVFALSLLGVSSEIKAQRTGYRTQNTGLCFSYPAEYEVVVSGQKIVGSAQKRGKRALLQQGSVFVRNTGPETLSLLKKPRKGYNAISVEEVLGREVVFEELSQAITKGFEEQLGVKFK